MRTRKKDADFTNIRIHIKTHEELDAIGKRGESMDDIVQKCLAAYREQQLQLHLQQQPLPPPPQQPISNSKSSRRVIKSDVGYDMIEQQRKIDKDLDLLMHPSPRHRFQVNLPGIEFPTHKKDIIEFAKKANIEMMVNFLKKLPNRGYMDKSDVENAFVNLFKDKEDHLREMYREGIQCIIDEAEIKQERRRQLLQEQEQQLLQQRLVK